MEVRNDGVHSCIHSNCFANAYSNGVLVCKRTRQRRQNRSYSNVDLVAVHAWGTYRSRGYCGMPENNMSLV